MLQLPPFLCQRNLNKLWLLPVYLFQLINQESVLRLVMFLNPLFSSAWTLCNNHYLFPVVGNRHILRYSLFPFAIFVLVKIKADLIASLTVSKRYVHTIEVLKRLSIVFREMIVRHPNFPTFIHLYQWAGKWSICLHSKAGRFHLCLGNLFEL